MPSRVRERRLFAGSSGFTSPYDSRFPVPLHAVWADDPLWAHPADGAGVAAWRNGGSVGGDPVQATALLQPLYRASVPAFAGHSTVEFDGLTTVLDVNPADINQPYKIVAVTSITTIAATRTYVGSGSSSRGGTVNSSGNDVLNFGAGTNSIAGNRGTGVHVVRGVVNGVSSTIVRDESASGAGDSGAQAYTRFTPGASGNSTPIYSQYWLGHIAYIGIYAGTTPDADLIALCVGLKTFYGIAA